MPVKALQGLHVNYITEGNGPPVILVHGTGGSLRHWDYLFPELVAEKYATYALDLLGHGDSAKPANQASGYHIDAIYAHLANWISRLDLHTAPILIGHGMGAYLSLIYAMRNPGKVRGMVLVSPYYTPAQLGIMLRFPILRPELSTKFLTMAPRWALSSIFTYRQRGDLLAKDIRELLINDLKRSDPNVITFAQTTHDLTPHLNRVRPRTIIIWGEQDHYFHLHQYSTLVDTIPNASGTSIPGSHNLHLTNFRVFNNQVLKFLDQLSGGLVPGPDSQPLPTANLFSLPSQLSQSEQI